MTSTSSQKSYKSAIDLLAFDSILDEFLNGIIRIANAFPSNHCSTPMIYETARLLMLGVVGTAALSRNTKTELRDLSKQNGSKLFEPNSDFDCLGITDKKLARGVPKNLLYELMVAFQKILDGHSDLFLTNILGQLLEASNSINLAKVKGKYTSENNSEMRRRGAVYHTPYFAAQHMVEASFTSTLDLQPFKRLCEVKIFEPAVGGGIFYLESFRNLLTRLEHSAKKKKTPTSRKWIARHILEECLYAVDISLASVVATKLSVFLALKEMGISGLSYDDLNLKIAEGDSLTFYSEVRGDSLQRLRELFDDDTLKDGFDFVIGNPPYDVLDKNSSSVGKYQFENLHGKVNLYSLFIHLGEKVLRSNGILSFVVPRNVLSDKSLSPTRRLLFVDALRTLSVDVFPKEPRADRLFKDAALPAMIFLSQKTPSQSHSVQLTKYKSGSTWEMEFRTHIGPDTLRQLLQSVDAIPVVPESEIRFITRCLGLKGTLGTVFGKLRQGEINISNYKDLISANDKALRLVEGKNISLGQLKGISKSVKLGQDDRKKEFFKKMRVVMQGINGIDDRKRLISTLVSDSMCAHSTNFAVFENIDDAHAFHAVLCSSYAERFFRSFSSNNNINSYEIERIPFVPNLKEFKSARNRLISESKKILNGHVSSVNEIDSIIEDIFAKVGA